MLPSSARPVFLTGLAPSQAAAHATLSVRFPRGLFRPAIWKDVEIVLDFVDHRFNGKDAGQDSVSCIETFEFRFLLLGPLHEFLSISPMQVEEVEFDFVSVAHLSFRWLLHHSVEGATHCSYNYSMLELRGITSLILRIFTVNGDVPQTASRCVCIDPSNLSVR